MVVRIFCMIKKVIRNSCRISEVFIKKGLAPGNKEPQHATGKDRQNKEINSFHPMVFKGEF